MKNPELVSIFGELRQVLTPKRSANVFRRSLARAQGLPFASPRSNASQSHGRWSKPWVVFHAKRFKTYGKKVWYQIWRDLGVWTSTNYFIYFGVNPRVPGFWSLLWSSIYLLQFEWEMMENQLTKDFWCSWTFLLLLRFYHILPINQSGWFWWPGFPHTGWIEAEKHRWNQWIIVYDLKRTSSVSNMLLEKISENIGSLCWKIS